MALVTRHIAHQYKTAVRTYSQKNIIKKTVLISQSKDIYSNLALEDWLYKNNNFSQNHVLFLWQNDPCVVIGRHQNPWLEANVQYLEQITENGVKLARRNSGGGTVYHDNGNLNMTFFTAREHYNRKYNLEVVKRALFREYSLKVDISTREDLTLRNCKVSGTAAKLGRPSAYHHCTLMVNVNKIHLSDALRKSDLGIETNATKSISSKVINLCEENPKVVVQTLIKAVGWEYLRTTPVEVQDGGLELANRQNGFQLVNPTDSWFPGLKNIRDGLDDWTWCYGKTPKFVISRSMTVPENGDIKITITVENGKISDVTLFLPSNLVQNDHFTGNVSVITHLKGCRFHEDVLGHLETLMNAIVNDKNISDCVRQVMTSV